MGYLPEVSDPFEEWIFICDCRDGYLRITWDEDEDDGWLWIEHRDAPVTWKERIRVIWRVLKGENWPRSDVVLRPESVDSLKEFLNSRKDPHS